MTSRAISFNRFKRTEKYFEEGHDKPYRHYRLYFNNPQMQYFFNSKFIISGFRFSLKLWIRLKIYAARYIFRLFSIWPCHAIFYDYHHHHHSSDKCTACDALRCFTLTDLTFFFFPFVFFLHECIHTLVYVCKWT